MVYILSCFLHFRWQFHSNCPHVCVCVRACVRVTQAYFTHTYYVYTYLHNHTWMYAYTHAYAVEIMCSLEFLHLEVCLIEVSSIITPCSASSFRGLQSSTQGNFAVIRTNLKFGNRAFSVSGPREWNSLPASVRQSTSVVQFKSRLKTHLFSLYYDLECSITWSRAKLVFVKAQYKCSVVLYCIVYRYNIIARGSIDVKKRFLRFLLFL